MEESTVVLESGSYFCRAGWAANELPSITLRDISSEMHSVETLFKPGGWSSYSPLNWENYFSIIRTEQELLWCRAMDIMLGSWGRPVALMDSSFTTVEQQHKVFEFFFESTNTTHLSLISEPTALTSALEFLTFSRTDPSEIRSPLKLDTQPLSFPLTSSSSGVVVTSDFESTRLQPFFSGITSSNLKLRHPLGERFSRALVFAKLHTSRSKDLELQDNKLEKNQNQKENKISYNTGTSNATIHKLKDHSCCWQLAQCLYERFSYVSFDADMDAWLIEKRSRAPFKTQKQICPLQTKTQLLHELVDSLPDWIPCERISKVSQNNTKPCCLCSTLYGPSNLNSPEEEVNYARDRSTLCGSSGRQISVSELSNLNDLLPNCLTSLEERVRSILGEYIFLAPEVMFQPKALFPSFYLNQPPRTSSSNQETLPSNTDLWYSESRNWAPSSLPDAILSVFDKSAIDLRRDMYRSIIILGNLAVVPFFATRVAVEVQAGLFKRLKKSISSSRLAAEALSKLKVQVWTPVSSEYAKCALWIGTKEALRNSSLKSNFAVSLSRQEYEEGHMIFQQSDV